MREFLFPRMKRMMDLTRQHGSHVFTHSDGAVREATLGLGMGMETADLHAVVGKVAANRGDAGTALRELERAVELAPFSSLRRSDLAIVMKMAGMEHRACEEMARFVETFRRVAMPAPFGHASPPQRLHFDLHPHSRGHAREALADLGEPL